MGADANAQNYAGLTSKTSPKCVCVCVRVCACVRVCISDLIPLFCLCAVPHISGLHFAARHGHTENCQLLIEGVGGVTMQPDGDGQTAVFHAVEGGHVECTEYLLTIGAKAGQLNNEKRRCVL